MSKSGVGNPSRSLAQLTKASSWRVLNLASLKPDAAKAAKPFFNNRKLDRAIIVKHTLRPAEREAFAPPPEIATKILVPFNPDDLTTGGYATFVGENRYFERLAEVTGVNPSAKPEHKRDLAVLECLASCPSLDPFVVRHLLQDSGYDVDESYFNIDVEQIIRMNAKLVSDIKPLVTLAMGREPTSSALTSFIDNVFRNRPEGQGLAFLTAVGIGVEQWPPLLFSWKAALVAEDSGEKLVTTVKGYLTILKELPILRSYVPEVNAEIARRKQILTDTVASAFTKCRQSMQKFGSQGRDQIIKSGNIGQMKPYLSSLKDSVRDYSLAFLQIDQATSTIQFYFGDRLRRMQPVPAQDFIDVTNSLMEICQPVA